MMLRSLASVFGFMLETIRLQHKRQEQELVAQDLRLQTSRSELKALRAQINPHFLFNALNAIASLIHTDPARADEAVEQLAEVFRYTLRRSDSEWAPLDQELAFARAYLDVEQARFGPAPLVPDRLGSPAAAATGAVDAAADADRERRQARRVADARAGPHRGDRPDHRVGDHDRSARQRPRPRRGADPAARGHAASACAACASGWPGTSAIARALSLDA